MKLRRIAGIGCIVLGVLNVIDLGSPIIPTMGPSAIIVGALFVAGGLFLLRPEGGTRPRLGSVFSNLRRRIGEQAAHLDPLLPVRVLRLAETRAGSLTVSVVAMALEVGLDDAQAALDELVRKGAASVDIDLASGIATYRFPEFLPPAGGPDAER
jgi:hypothetical protein